MSDEPLHVIVVTDPRYGNEALYVGGDMGKDDQVWIDARQIVDCVGDQVMQLSCLEIRRPEDGQFPKRLEDCLLLALPGQQLSGKV